MAGSRRPDGSHNWTVDLEEVPGEDGLLPQERGNAKPLECRVLDDMLRLMDVAGAIDYYRAKGKPEHLRKVFLKYPIYNHVRIKCES